MEKMERVQDLVTLTLFLFYKTCSIKSRKFTVDMIDFASKKGKLMVESLVSIVLKHTKRSKLLARRDHKLFIHSYEFSCNSTPQSSQPFRSRIKRNGYSKYFLPCLSGKALDVESESVVILPRDHMMHHSDPVLAIEGPQKFNSSIEQLHTCDDGSGALLPIEGPYSPVAAGSMEDTFNRSGPTFAIDSLWSPIRSKDENYIEPDIDWLAEEFIRGFYQKLREQIF